MALDGAFLSIIKKKLDFLVSGKVDKVYQPSKQDLILTIKQGGTQRLLISSSPDRARIQLTENSPENPETPPMFCMLMRKHLGGSRIKAIRQDGLERIIYIDFDAVNELGENVVLTLCCELMGRYSNIILVNQEGRIIDSIKRIDAATGANRLVLPGMRYEKIPPSQKLDIFSPDSADRFFSQPHPGELSKEIVASFEGISPLIAREWTFYAGRGRELCLAEMEEGEADRLRFAISQTREMIEEGRLEFTVLKTREGILKEFTFLNISQYGNLLVKEYFDDAFSMLDYFYQNKDRAAAMRQKADDLFKIIVSSVERISKKLSIQQADIEKCAKKDKYKEKGDLISSYIYSIKKGDREARLANFYKEGSPTETVALDPLLSPSENAQKYYKKYKKAVNAEKYLTEQIKKGKEELEYFDTVLDALTRAETSADIAQLRNELSDQGYIKKRNSAARRQKPPAPLEYFSSDGFRILVGRNNVQNDKLTMKTANKHDIWLHTQKIPGSHVIIFTEGREVPDRTIVEAASLAAWHSKARNSDKTAVDYCPVKFVKKPPESKPGMVIFSNYKTILVSPSEIRPES